MLVQNPCARSAQRCAQRSAPRSGAQRPPKAGEADATQKRHFRVRHFGAMIENANKMAPFGTSVGEILRDFDGIPARAPRRMCQIDVKLTTKGTRTKNFAPAAR